MKRGEGRRTCTRDQPRDKVPRARSVRKADERNKESTVAAIERRYFSPRSKAEVARHTRREKWNDTEYASNDQLNVNSFCYISPIPSRPLHPHAPPSSTPVTLVRLRVSLRGKHEERRAHITDEGRSFLSAELHRRR